MTNKKLPPEWNSPSKPTFPEFAQFFSSPKLEITPSQELLLKAIASTPPDAGLVCHWPRRIFDDTLRELFATGKCATHMIVDNEIVAIDEVNIQEMSCTDS